MKKFLCYDTNDAASGRVNVDRCGVLRPNATVPSTNGAPYQQLVTDGDGNVKWEDRLAYDDSKVVVKMSNGQKLARVSDEIPSWASADASVKVVINNGADYTVVLSAITDEILACSEFAVFVKADGAEFLNLTFPKKGVYFTYGKDEGGRLVYISSVSSADSEASKITWDGNIETIKKTIDPKYIPSELNEVILPSSTSGSSKKFKITVDDSGAITATEQYNESLTQTER